MLFFYLVRICGVNNPDHVIPEDLTKGTTSHSILFVFPGV